MKKYFFAGLLALIPLALTIFVGLYILDLLTGPFVHFARDLLTHLQIFKYFNVSGQSSLIYFITRLIVLALLLATVFLTGYLGERFFVYQFFSLTDKLFRKIPIVKAVYKLTMEITKSVLNDSKKTFDKSVVIPFPDSSSYAFGFETGEVPEAIKRVVKVNKTIFMPTAPHPISGFLLMCSAKEVKKVDVQVEEAFKFIISCGAITPTEKIRSKKVSKKKKRI